MQYDLRLQEVESVIDGIDTKGELCLHPITSKSISSPLSLIRMTAVMAPPTLEDLIVADNRP